MRVTKNRGLECVDVETYCSAHNQFYSILAAREPDPDLRPLVEAMKVLLDHVKDLRGPGESPEKAFGVSMTIFHRFCASEKFVHRYFGKKEFYGHVRRDGDCWSLSPKFMELCARAHCDNRGFRAREIFSELSRFPVSAGEDWPPVQTEVVQ